MTNTLLIQDLKNIIADNKVDGVLLIHFNNFMREAEHNRYHDYKSEEIFPKTTLKRDLNMLCGFCVCNPKLFAAVQSLHIKITSGTYDEEPDADDDVEMTNLLHSLTGPVMTKLGEKK